MLATLYFLGLLSLTYADTTQIISASDSSLVFSPGWSQEYSQTTDDSFMQTDSPVATLTATLPDSASSVSYVGYKRAGGSMYGYCVDCGQGKQGTWILQTANGSDPSATDDATTDGSTIFSVDLDPSTQHTLTVYNLPTNQFNAASEINFDHLSVLVQDNDTDERVPVGQALSRGALQSSSSASQSQTSATTSPTAVSLGQSIAPPKSGTATSTGVVSSTTNGPATTTTNPPLQSVPASTSGIANTATSSGITGGPSKSLIAGISILSVVLGGSIIVGLVVFLRQRNEKRKGLRTLRLSSASSIIPIMPPPPPQMRTASLNPFSDPELPPPLDSPLNSSLMQRRMESRTNSPSGSAPTIPLPELPPDRPYRMESRSNSPASAFARSGDLWITRPVQTPVKTQFSAV